MQKSHGFSCNTRSNYREKELSGLSNTWYISMIQVKFGTVEVVMSQKTYFNRQIIFTQIIYRHLVYQRKRSEILRDYLVHTFYICNVTISHRLQSFCMKTSIVWTSLWKLTIASVGTSGESDYVPLYSCHPFDWLSS